MQELTSSGYQYVSLDDSNDNSTGENVEKFQLQDTIKVISHETAGTYLFKHTVYSVVSQSLESKTARRYSDFVWLRECLVKKYPFRIIATLPPKRIGATMDDPFIEKRMKGLERFLNILSRHVVLGQDKLFQQFLKDPQDIKKFGTLHLDEEYFVGYPSEAALNEVPENVEFQLKSIEDRIGRFRNSFQTILVSLENINQKKLEHSNELKKISQFFGSLLDGECAAIHCSIESCGNCGSLVQECNHIKNGFIKISEIFDESTKSIENDAAVLALTFFAILEGYDQLFKRAKEIMMLDYDSIEKRMAQKELKIEKLKLKQSNPEDIDKLRSSIEQDKEELEFHKKRNQFARYCMWKEHQYFESTKSIFVASIQQFCRGEVKLNVALNPLWRTLSPHLEKLPNFQVR